MYVEQKKNGKYLLRDKYKDPYTGKWKAISVGIEKDSAQAVNKAKLILQKKIEERTTVDKKDNNMTFGELYDEWYKYYKIQNKRTSWIKVPFYMDNHVFPIITKDMKISAITPSLVNDVIEKMYTFGKYSLNYTKQTRTTISTIFNFAIEKGYIDSNPVSKVKVNIKREQERQHRKKIGDKYLEKNEYKAILKELYSDGNRRLQALVAEFLLLTGLRYGELMALQWKNFDGKSISIEGTLDYTMTKITEAVKTSTKNVSSERIVDLPERGIKILEEQKVFNSFKFSTNPDDFIFLSRKNSPLTIHAFNKSLKEAAKKIELGKNVTSHIFRHTHVSILAEDNIPLKAIMERVGHSDANTTLSIYNHVTKKSREQITHSLDNIF
ncbi:tyrosine-type recombinase/integrase [Lactococcus hircilactis]|uniref:Tyrosine-type recombinase/integrase n=1 Tax=Lactococcus hircilactis TaxID=1494462 RepID=A0A7X2D269_9LACT|nr:tyrosine-type recombinase/integrase [Lactococcus hircilactis]MQW40177.1 tyrosine-type recombinase/integrase [Lactococcus hircilactis]